MARPKSPLLTSITTAVVSTRVWSVMLPPTICEAPTSEIVSGLVLLVAGVLLTLASCTDASVYSVQGKGANLPDRATFEGLVCVPTPAGKQFPTRILYTVQGGQGIDATTRQQVVDAIGIR